MKPGDLLADRFRLDAVLDNTSDFSTVWIGDDTVLQRPVAIRTLKLSDNRTAQVLAGAQRAAEINDPSCVHVLDIGRAEESNTAFIVTAYVQADTLSDVLADGPLDAVESADLVAEIADTIARVHDRGIAHGCLDPLQILLAPTGDAIVLGLGTALAVHHPERDAEMVDDVRSLGAVLYACLTARWPMASSTGLPAAVRDGADPVPPRKARAHVPTPLDRLCRRALGETVAGEEPFDNAREFSVALRAHLTRSGTTAAQRLDRRRSTGPVTTLKGVRQQGRRGVIALIALAVSIVIGGLLLLGVQVLNSVFAEPGGSPPPGPAATNR